MLGHVRLHAIGRLIHRNGYADEPDLTAVFGVDGLEMRLELAAVRAPRCPEFDEHGRLADVVRKVGRFAVKRLDRHGRCLAADLESHILPAQLARRGEHCTR